MYEVIIKEYLKRLSLKDINDFANKNNVSLKSGEDKILYDFIMRGISRSRGLNYLMNLKINLGTKKN